MLRWLFAGMAATVFLVAAAAWSLKPAPASHTALPPAKPSIAFAPSLSGTEADGEIAQGKGDLQLNQALLMRFDYYLSATGERPLADIMAQIGRDLDHELKPEAAKEARRILAQYLQFKRALGELAKNPAMAGQNLETIRLRLTAIQDTRSRFFSRQEIAALFGEDDQQDNLLLERLAISQNAQLSTAQKVQKLAALDAQLSPAAQQARAELVQHLTLAARIDNARQAGASAGQAGASAGQLHQIRSQSLGEEAANRLAALDKEESQWQSKIETYLAARNNAISTLPLAEQNTAVQKLRDQYFSVQEQKRLGAFE
ncbi:lipase secretion chaperone [Iodobacter fluviatilis]|uniref:Lipase helper protein n=1 Tax=Iodobacter fluviatilis TaxID=537 RepID=A0A377SYI2_9NEIS|nr:lipase secretion chaperone [Iodobacter fluviatilis]TCU81375.1 lipase chaperone LimK [Iodobacter fluviatilis]STR46043.1 Lipase modulator [Iodobacter fluviatilis]